MASVEDRLRALRAANRKPSVDDRLRALREAQPTEPDFPQPQTAGQETEEMLGIDPTLQRGTILPLARTQEGEMTLAAPEFAVDLAKAVMLPGQAVQPATLGRDPVEITERDVTKAALDVAPTRGLAAGVAARRPTLRRYIDESPTAEALKTEALDIYQRAQNQGVQVDPSAMADFATKTRAYFDKNFPSNKLYGRSRSVLRDWEKRIKSGQPFTVEDLEIMRREAGDAAANIDPVETKAAVELKDAVDDFVGGLDAGQLISGDPSQVPGLLRQYRAYYTRQAKMRTLAEMVERAELSPQGIEGGMRVEVRNFLKNRKRSRGWTKAEKARLEDITKGDTLQKTLRFISTLGLPAGGSNRVLGTFLGAGTGYGLGSLMGFPELGAGAGTAGALGVIGMGNLAGRGAIRRTNRNVELARAMLARGNQYPRVQPTSEAIARRLAGPVVGSQIDDERQKRIERFMLEGGI